MGKYSAVESLLIEEVQKYPALWKTTDSEYKNRAAKDSAWAAITESVNAASNTTYSVLDYRDKIWKNLRDSYVRILSGRNYKSLVYDTGDISKHPHLEPLSFLKIYINPRKSTSKKLFPMASDTRVANIEPKSESDEDPPSDNTEMQSTDATSMVDRIHTDPEVDDNNPLRAAKRPFNAQTSPNGHDKSTMDCKILEYFSRSAASACPCTQSREERCEMDADTLFGQSIAAQLRMLDKKSNAIAKVKIQQILLDLQFPDNINS
ncbi:hypothetical protein QZH41_015682 [Actinostola sp. cb2023]|nr:hypothetical protein QZH41_015682 [Actinostola sp. cb2023]